MNAYLDKHLKECFRNFDRNRKETEKLNPIVIDGSREFKNLELFIAEFTLHSDSCFTISVEIEFVR